MNFVRQIWTHSHKCFSTLLFPQKNRTQNYGSQTRTRQTTRRLSTDAATSFRSPCSQKFPLAAAPRVFDRARKCSFANWMDVALQPVQKHGKSDTRRSERGRKWRSATYCTFINLSCHGFWVSCERHSTSMWFPAKREKKKKNQVTHFLKL